MKALKTETNKQNKKILLTAVITAVITLFISFIIFYLLFFLDGIYLKLKQLDYLVENYFYGEIDTNKINDLIVRGYISGLDDKYANYYSLEDTEQRNNSLSGKGQGIGIIVVKHPDNENIYVKNVYEKGPAFEAGIRAGDCIVAVDGKKVADMGYSEAVDFILRDIGDKMILDISREEKVFKAEVTCTEFAAQTVFSKLINDKYGYIEITSFNGETALQFENAINQLEASGAKALIFDLRGNGGGTVDAVCEMVDFICPEGTIMTVKYSNGKTEVIGESNKEEINLPMVVLTDGATASASELFTASVKDFGKGISVGSKTYGKGVMQTTYNFTDGSSVAFTVAEFLPHSQESFNLKGIEPDIAVALTEEEIKYQHIITEEKDSVILAAIGYLDEQ